MPDEPGHSSPDPDAAAAVDAVRSGDADALAQLLGARSELATGLVPGHGGRTLLHVATDWPGHLPHVAATIAVLVAHGADPDAAFVGAHRETPLHWAASCDDVAALDALLDAGADIDARGGVIGGGTPLDDATAFRQWRAAWRLVERGAGVSAWDAAALGLTDRLADHLAAEPDAALDPLLWAAAHGGRHSTAALLVDAGADVAWVGWDGLTPADAAERAGATELAAWLRTRRPGGPG